MPGIRTLSEIDHEALPDLLAGRRLLDAIETSLYVRSRRDWSAWVRGELQEVIPHEAMVSWTENRADVFIDVGGQASGALTEEAVTAAFSATTGLLPQIGEIWRSAECPCYFSALDTSPVACGDISTRLRQYGFTDLIVHGVSNSGQPEACALFCFIHLGNFSESYYRYALEILTPHLHMALMRVLTRDLREESVQLTLREKEIMCWVREGKSNWEIGVILDISEQTVKNHLTSVLKKLSAHNRGHAVARATRLRII